MRIQTGTSGIDYLKVAGAKRRKSGQAFTLVEMLLVVVIIGVLAGAMVAGLAGRSQEARVARAKADITGSLPLALDLFNQDVGRYPTSEEGLTALVQDPGVGNWKGPYMQSGLKPDPWGAAYHYELDPNQPSQYVLKSAGPDAQVNTADDVMR